MKKYRYAMVYLLSTLLLCGCNVTSSLRRHAYNAQVIHTPRAVSETPKKDSVPQYIVYQPSEGKQAHYLIPTTTLDNAERIMSFQLEEVTVLAPSRSLPERLGKVNIDFAVTLPKSLQGSCRNIVVVPILHNQELRTPLQELSIRGALFDKVQQRDYWQYSRYVDLYSPDSVKSQQIFDRFVRFPYPEDVRLDSVRIDRSDICYYYTQEVSTARVGKRMTITLEGRVEGLDGSYYRLPPCDTLQYNISSMLNFADTTTRYVERVISKYAVVQDRNYLSFGVNDTQIIDSLGQNAVQLTRIEELMDQLVHHSEFYVDSITLTASASPDGGYARNAQLAMGRALSLRNHLIKKFPNEGIDTIICIRSTAEGWDELSRLIETDSTLLAREQILALWQDYPNPDRREGELQKRYPGQYAFIRERLYPLLRSVNFKYNLRRIGMIQDTIRTTEKDTLYARGVELMNERRYTDALAILTPYKDRNTAITLLSLGYDRQALQVLATLPESDIVCYMQAIAYARTQKKKQAQECFARACQLNPNMEYRGKLDPEITRLNE